MRNIIIISACLLQLLAGAGRSFAQYFNRLYDLDSSIDWGRAIFEREDGSYFITGNYQTTTLRSRIINMIVSADGSTIISQHQQANDSGGLYQGEWGEARKLSGGGYITPLTIQYPNPATGYLYSTAGFVRYKENGDTVFMKTYTDTSVHFDKILNCDIMPDGGFVGGGGHGTNIPSYYPALIVRTDSIGDTLWTHIYQKYATQSAQINAVLSLPDSRIVAGSHSRYDVVTPALDVYYHFSPWFMVLDANGNIIRDTVYSSKYGGGGRLYRDTIGGYAHIGQIDTLAYPLVPENYQNLPCYIAHLDTNFRMSWITRFPYSIEGRRHPLTVKQLRDGNYLAIGISEKWPKIWAWAAKVNRNDGSIMWEHYYVSDSLNDNYLSDGAEKADGSLVFTGATFNDTLPSYRRVFDVWLLGTDSNGCPTPLCFEDTTLSPIGLVEIVNTSFSIFPNPTTGAITINAPQAGELTIYNIQGQVVSTYRLKKGAANIGLPQGVGAGMYVCRYTSHEGDKTPVVVRLVYSP